MKRHDSFILFHVFMATVINNPGRAETADHSSVGTVIAVLLALAGIFLLVVYGVPALRRSTAGTDGGTNINVQVPNPTGGSGTQGTGGEGGSGAGQAQ